MRTAEQTRVLPQPQQKLSEVAMSLAYNVCTALTVVVLLLFIILSQDKHRDQHLHPNTQTTSPITKTYNMNSIIARFITTFCLASACFGAATTSMQPVRWARYDLEVPIGESETSEIAITQDNSTDFALEKRRQVGVCEAITVTASCIAIKNELKSYVLYMANVIKDLSNQRSCGALEMSSSGTTRMARTATRPPSRQPLPERLRTI